MYTQRWLIKHKLWTPLRRYWKGSPYNMLNTLYPNRYAKDMLKGYKINNDYIRSLTYLIQYQV